MGDAALVVRPMRKHYTVEPLMLSSQSSRAPKESESRSSCLGSEEECDRDYIFFLERGAEGMADDEGSHDRFIEAKSSNADDSDPQYLSFLEHLREDGKSYTLVGEGNHGEIVLHKYERQENVGSEGLNLHAKRLKPINPEVSIKKRLVASAKNFRRVLRSDTSKDLQELCNSKDTSWRKGNDKAVRIPKDTLGRKGNDKAVRIPKESSCRRQECKRNEAVPLGNHASRVREDSKRKAPQPLQTKSSEKQQEESEQWDDSYMVFLHHVRKDGEVVLFNHDSRTVRYNEDELEESSSSDVEILAQEDILENEENNPFVTTRMACIDLEAADPGESDHSEFRVKLLEILKAPYNVNEYNDLLRKVKHRRQKEIIREMRGGREVSYPTKRSCPSYLDQYTDLADKISLAKGDRLLTLNILRGFFFYLSNLPMEGVFRPWMDQSSMSIMPPVTPGLQSSMSIMPPVAPGLVERIPCLKAEPSEIFSPTPPQFAKPPQRLKVERS